MIEYTTLGDIVAKTEIHYDPNPRTTVVEEDKAWLDEFFLMEDDYNPANYSPWVRCVTWLLL